MFDSFCSQFRSKKAFNIDSHTRISRFEELYDLDEQLKALITEAEGHNKASCAKDENISKCLFTISRIYCHHGSELMDSYVEVKNDEAYFLIHASTSCIDKYQKMHRMYG